MSGTKHKCYRCSSKFYDLGKPEAICPKCRANQKDAPIKVEPVTDTWRPYAYSERTVLKLSGRK